MDEPPHWTVRFGLVSPAIYSRRSHELLKAQPEQSPTSSISDFCRDAHLWMRRAAIIRHVMQWLLFWQVVHNRAAKVLLFVAIVAIEIFQFLALRDVVLVWQRDKDEVKWHEVNYSATWRADLRNYLGREPIDEDNIRTAEWNGVNTRQHDERRQIRYSELRALVGQGLQAQFPIRVKPPDHEIERMRQEKRRFPVACVNVSCLVWLLWCFSMSAYFTYVTGTTAIQMGVAATSSGRQDMYVRFYLSWTWFCMSHAQTLCALMWYTPLSYRLDNHDAPIRANAWQPSWDRMRGRDPAPTYGQPESLRVSLISRTFTESWDKVEIRFLMLAHFCCSKRDLNGAARDCNGKLRRWQSTHHDSMLGWAFASNCQALKDMRPTSLPDDAEIGRVWNSARLVMKTCVNYMWFTVIMNKSVLILFRSLEPMPDQSIDAWDILCGIEAIAGPWLIMAATDGAYLCQTWKLYTDARALEHQDPPRDRPPCRTMYAHLSAGFLIIGAVGALASWNLTVFLRDVFLSWIIRGGAVAPS